MKIITTPMCEDILTIAGLSNYEVVNPKEIKDADIAILLTETKSEIPKLSIKLNTYTQILESVLKVQKKFNTRINNNQLDEVKNLIDENNEKKDNRKSTKVKVYSNFLKETVEDMGFNLCDEEYEYIVMPDYMDIPEEDNVIIIPSHTNVSKDLLERVKERYDLLERELCTKQ
ncbi:MAG: hypothetical protein IJJ47_06130 [Methanosphaera sp.]|nr:hypothetical protein [Methanosphaera sp.]